MGDDFVLSADRLLTESTLEGFIEIESRLQATPLSSNDDMRFPHSMDEKYGSSPSKMVQCRICHDEDEDSNMETPCSCCGSLKYAHRICVQRWCNEKGDTICEICQQQFKPGYTAPPPLLHYGGSPVNFRGNWEISRRDLHNHQFIAMALSPNREFLDTEFEFSAPSTRSLICCRIVTIIFLVLLMLRHILPIIISGDGEFSLTLVMLLVLRTIGVLLPVFIMVKAFTAIQRRRHQDHYFSSMPSHEEIDLVHAWSRIVHIW